MKNSILKTIMTLLVLVNSHLYGGLAKNNFDNKYINDHFKKYNYRYKMVAVDTRYWTKNKKDILKKRAIITKFGNALGKKAIVQNLIMKTSKKRAYVRKIQKQLGSNYNLNKAPFLIFFKKAKKGYNPYKIISLASFSTPYLKQELSLLGKAINQGKSNKTVYANLDRVKKKVYVINKKVKATSREKKTIYALIDVLKSWFSPS